MNTQQEYMIAMRELAREAKAKGLTSAGDVIEEVASWEVGPLEVAADSAELKPADWIARIIEDGS